MGALINFNQVPLFVCHANAARHMSVFSQCIFKPVPYHHILILSVIFILCQKPVRHPECIASIIVVRIDDNKRSVHNPDTAHNSMTRSPGLHPSLRYFKPVRNIIQILKNIRCFNLFFNPVANGGTKALLVLSFDNKNNPFKACTNCVINRKIHNNVPIFIHRINLFQTAIAASHPCSHHN